MEGYRRNADEDQVFVKRLRKIAGLTMLFGVLLTLAGMLDRPLVRARPVKNTDGTVARDASGAPRYDPASLKRSRAMTRQADMMCLSGLVVIGAGAILWVMSREVA